MAALIPTRARRERRRFQWVVELLLVVALYEAYSVLRSTVEGDPEVAFRHANAIIDLQKSLGFFWEPAIQQWALQSRWLIIAANWFYGTLHFVVTIGVLVWAFVKSKALYRMARNALALTTVVAFVFFAAFPLMPPRLLDAARSVGGGAARYGFVDTLLHYPSMWSFSPKDSVGGVSNQYAAMPSLHCAWALWCALVVFPRARRWWTKALVASYPLMTAFVIVITGNHYFLDAVAGFAVVSIVYMLVARISQRRNAAASGATGDDDVVDLAAAEREERELARAHVG